MKGKKKINKHYLFHKGMQEAYSEMNE